LPALTTSQTAPPRRSRDVLSRSWLTPSRTLFAGPTATRCRSPTYRGLAAAAPSASDENARQIRWRGRPCPCAEHDVYLSDPGASDAGRRRLRLVQPVDDGGNENRGPAEHEAHC